MRTLMRATIALIDGLSKAGAVVAACLLLLLLVVLSLELVMRGVFSISISFAWEYAGYALGTMLFTGAAYTLRSGTHIRVSFLLNMKARGFGRALDFCGTLFGLACTIYLAYAMVLLTVKSGIGNSVSSLPSQTPMVIPQTLVAAGAVLLALQMFARLLRFFLGQPPDVKLGTDTAFGIEG
ncbi:MAG: TRAP transporter small permease subunit [Alphaproteobacteria bacterium]